MKTGDHVRYNAQFLRNTGQYTGPDAPCHHGPWAYGVVLRWVPELSHHVRVLWDDGTETTVHAANLEVR